MEWSKIESIIGEPLPCCVKKILDYCAFDTLLSIELLNDEHIKNIEEYVSKERKILYELTCDHGREYQKHPLFKFLPGHRILLIDLPTHVKMLREKNTEITGIHDSRFSVVLNELVNTATSNSKVDKHHARYSEELRYVATYTYLQGGKSCYEFLNRNLPFPSTKTICKPILKLHFK